QGFERADECRRGYGAVLDALGCGAIRTPSRILCEEAGLRLHAFGGAAASPALLILPAPIKRAYIWDLAPDVSVVRRCLAQGLRVFLAEWTDDAPADFGLEHYADRLPLAAIAAIAGEAGGQRVMLAGHSLGGTLAAIFAALHPRRVRALVLLESPLRFGPAAGAFAPLVATTPARPIRDLFGAVPGSFLDAASAAAAPESFIAARWRDAVATAGDRPGRLTRLRVERWTCDEFALPGRLFEAVVELLYREDRFMAGRLTVGGRKATPQALAMPILGTFRPKSRIVPPATILPLRDVARHPRNRLTRYDGEHGVALQHVGILVGRKAHAETWPEILDWIDRCGE
ncbi:MAG TPA: alpha/beta fold hydrolase, partial [Stellaceae bacterium]|nr:alpha/beta fold hydrolase [Stellaceae bacterium]